MQPKRRHPGSLVAQDRGHRSKVELLALPVCPDYLAGSAEEGLCGEGAMPQSQLGTRWHPRHQQCWTHQELLFP